MKIWLLESNSRFRIVNPIDLSYNEVHSLVIRAQDEAQARKLASDCAEGEGNESWLDPSLSTCKEISLDGEPQVLLFRIY